MTQYSTEPEFSLEEKLVKTSQEVALSNHLSRDFSQVVVDLEELCLELSKLVDMSLRSVDAIQNLVVSLQGME